MSSDNSSNNNTNTQDSSAISPVSRPKLTLNFSKGLAAEVAKKLEALKPKEKVAEEETKPKSQVQDQGHSQEQKQQKEQSSKAKLLPDSQDNKAVATKKQSNDDKAITSSKKTKAEANLAAPAAANKAKIQKTPDTIPNMQLATTFKQNKSVANKTSIIETATTVVKATIKDKNQLAATSAVAAGDNSSTEVKEVNSDTDKADIEGRIDNTKANDQAELKPKLALQNKKWLLKPEIYKKMIKEFRADFPNCFTTPKKPLALTIRAELIAAKPEYSKTEIGKFLQIYCMEKAYKQSLVLDAQRVNLNGEISSLVTEEQLAKDKHNLKFENKESQ